MFMDLMILQLIQKILKNIEIDFKLFCEREIDL